MMSLSSESSLENMSPVLPEIKLDSSAEDWEELMVSWAKYQEKYKLASPGLIRQLINCFQFIDSLSHHGLEVNVSDQPDSIPERTVSASTAAQDMVASEKRSRKRSRHKSRKKNLTVREDDERLDTTTTFMTENKSYQPDDFQFNSLSFGEIAALMYSARKVSREMQAIHKVKIPHMLQENMKWIVRRAESQPVIRLAVQVSTKSYSANNIKPPSAYRHRQADMEMLADTGSQAVIMGTNQLGQLGLTVRDLMDCEMSLSGVTNSSVQIIGALFVRVRGAGCRRQHGGCSRWSGRFCK